MTIMLVNPPGAVGTTANREGSGGLGVVTPGTGGFVYPPQTLAYVAASLREAGYAVAALDAVVEELTIPETLAALEQGSRGAGEQESSPSAQQAFPSVVGVQISVATLGADLGFVNALGRPDRSFGDLSGLSIFVFGYGARYVWRQVLEGSAARLAVLGEAEFYASAVVEALAVDDPQALAELPGVAYRLNGEIVSRPDRSFGDLSGLPYPAWDLLPHDRYPFLTLAASRGCDDGCAYCPYVAAQGPFRPRSPQAVAAEARWLERTFRPPRLVFRDPAFAADRERAIALGEGLRRARVRTPWECESRPEHFDADLLYRLRRAGCQTVKLGLETVDEALLWGMNRLLPGWTVARYRAHVAELVAASRRLGLNCHIFVMTGLPGETRAALEATLAFLQAVRPPAVSVKRYRPYPGTRLGEEIGDVSGLPALPEVELARFEGAMRATAEPLLPHRRPLLHRMLGR